MIFLSVVGIYRNAAPSIGEITAYALSVSKMNKVFGRPIVRADGCTGGRLLAFPIFLSGSAFFLRG